MAEDGCRCGACPPQELYSNVLLPTPDELLFKKWSRSVQHLRCALANFSIFAVVYEFVVSLLYTEDWMTSEGPRSTWSGAAAGFSFITCIMNIILRCTINEKRNGVLKCTLYVLVVFYKVCIAWHLILLYRIFVYAEGYFLGLEGFSCDLYAALSIIIYKLLLEIRWGLPPEYPDVVPSYDRMDDVL